MTIQRLIYGAAFVLFLVGFSGQALAQFTLTQTHAVQIGGTGGPPDAADVAVLDVDQDGKMDIVTYNSDGIDSEPVKADFLAILLGNGDGTFQPPIQTDEVGFTVIDGLSDVRSRLMAGEFSGDTYPDLVLTHKDTKEVALFINNKAGSFDAAILYDTGYRAGSLHVGDYNEDEKDDVLVLSNAGYNVIFLAGTGAGTLAAPVVQPSGVLSDYEPRDFDVADLDGDGHLDVLAPYLHDESGVDLNRAIGFHGRGDGTFDVNAPFFIETGTGDFNQPVYLQIADLDADGHPDVAVTNYNILSAATPQNVHVAYGSAAGWEPAVPYTTSWESFTELTLADMNFDGRLDIVAICDGPMGFEVLLGDGAHNFTSQGFVDTYPPAAGMFSVVAADVTADGKLDLIFGTHYTGHVLVYRNDTPGTLAQRFTRGDTNADGDFNIADVITTLSALFASGSLTCDDAADTNDDGALNIADAIYSLSTLFASGPEPPAPYAECGVDPTTEDDDLDCGSFKACP
jgi:hypothetical protein